MKSRTVLEHFLATALFATGNLGAQSTTAGQARPGGPVDPSRPGFRPPTPIQSMSLTTTGWADGGVIPIKYTQEGPELSPGIQWSGAPTGTTTYVLTFTDVDTAVNNARDGVLHWMLWNIPGTATAIAQGAPEGFEWPDGTRQVPPQGPQEPNPNVQDIRNAIRQAMVGHIRAKGAFVGFFHRVP